ncbi:hypothetical protein EKH79_14905 [Dyella dinghuensis]|uniref:Uncharacterized protein n=1 Tax=Dyella dinghuensis TaxID=1920169 RepID=A0A3S0PAG2_9GAMM|nr:hypothetical protein [Dyella dinghuensis]RUL62178.1 hypothetical protein EKH79_14905 [Dyella dinghuensis]
MGLPLPRALTAGDDRCTKIGVQLYKALANRLKAPFGFLRRAGIVVRDHCERRDLSGNAWTSLSMVRERLDVLSAIIESDNRAHTSLVDGYVSATI